MYQSNTITSMDMKTVLRMFNNKPFLHKLNIFKNRPILNNDNIFFVHICKINLLQKSTEFLAHVPSIAIVIRPKT